MYLKIMSGEASPDGDTRKPFRVLDKVVDVDFQRQGEAPTVEVKFEKGETESFTLEGNAYLMNEAGKTIAQFGVAAFPAAR